jgi:hypothetical protein
MVSVAGRRIFFPTSRFPSDAMGEVDGGPTLPAMAGAREPGAKCRRRRHRGRGARPIAVDEGQATRLPCTKIRGEIRGKDAARIAAKLDAHVRQFLDAVEAIPAHAGISGTRSMTTGR